MARRMGYATVSMPGATHEADTLCCAHCQAVIFLHAMPGLARGRAPRAPGYCPHCSATICNGCAVAGGCDPFEEKVRREEERGAEQRRMARELGLA